MVVLTNGGESGKTVALGADLAHTARRDFLGNRQEEITTDDRAAPISRSTQAASASGCRPPACERPPPRNDDAAAKLCLPFGSNLRYQLRKPFTPEPK